MSRFGPCAIFLTSALLVGCGDQSGTYPASGTVTFEGKPVPRGSVGFIADYSKGNKGTQVYAPIIGGKFETPPGKGHRGGAYKIRVLGLDGVAKETTEGDTDENGSPLFPIYEMDSEFAEAAEVIDIEVPSEP